VVALKASGWYVNVSCTQNSIERRGEEHMIYGLLIINDNGGRPWLNLKIYELSVWKQQRRKSTQVSVPSPRGACLSTPKGMEG
jgi:hypothetical protein